MRTSRTSILLLVAVGSAIGASVAHGALPPYTVARLYQSGQNVSQVGPINNPFNSGVYGGAGILGLAVNNSGAAFVHVGTYTPPPPPLPASPIFGNYNHAMLSSGLGLVPYLGGGVEWDNTNPPGSVTVPGPGYIYDESFWTAVNNDGVGVFDLRLGPDSFSTNDPLTGVYFNKSAMPIKEGDAITAAGVSPGTVFGAFGPDRVSRYQSNSPLTSTVQITDTNILLYAGVIIEGGVSKRAILKIALDGNGAVQSQSLVAKEGGPVGTGPATWSVVSTTPNTVAINNAGQVIFSGTTSGGIDGVFLASGSGGSFVATAGGPAPSSNGGVWGVLTGVPVDINNSGQFAFRGVVQGTGAWSEVGDAGETFSTFLSYTANGTTGGGPLTQISGALSSDYDVDVYYITVGDPTLPTQVPFSATTVPDPAHGFAGAGFDTVLYLFADNQNCNGNTRVGVGRNDDAAPGVAQSTLTTASLRSDHTPGARYFLAVSTPRARAVSRGLDAWQMLPWDLATAGGVVYWMDPGHGQIARASLTTGSLLAPLSVGPAPTQTTGGQPAGIDGPLLDARIAIYDAGNGGPGSKLVFHRRGWGADAFQTCDLDGSNVQTLAPSLGGSGGVTSIACDSAHGKFYWATISAVRSFISRCDLDGSNAQVVVSPVDSCDCDTYSVDAMAIDTFGTGRLYWYEALSNRIVYENLADLPDLSGAHLHQVITNAGVSGMAIDSTNRRLYYASTPGNKIGVIDLNSNTAMSNLAATPAPRGVAFDGTSGRVYWSAPYERLLRRSLVGAPSVETWLSIGQDLGERPSDGPNFMDCVVSGFNRSGTQGSTALPYQIKLTGATYANVAAMVCKNNATKVALGGEGLASTAGQALTAVGSTRGPIRISDRGLVAWRGEWYTSGGAVRRGLFLGTDKVLDDTTVPAGGGNQLGSMDSGAAGMDMSSSGQYLLANTFYGGFVGGGNNCVLVSFSSVPGCSADFNGDGSLTVQDIFDFLSAWFAGSPSADFNGQSGISVQDIFDYLAAWFAGC